MGKKWSFYFTSCVSIWIIGSVKTAANLLHGNQCQMCLWFGGKDGSTNNTQHHHHILLITLEDLKDHMACSVRRINLYSEKKEKKNRKILYVHWFCRGKDTNWWLESRGRKKNSCFSRPYSKPVMKQKCPKRAEKNMTKRYRRQQNRKNTKQWGRNMSP